MNKTKTAISAQDICFANGQTLQDLFDSGKLITTKTVVTKELAKEDKTKQENTEKEIQKINNTLKEIKERFDDEYEKIKGYFKFKDEEYQNTVRESSGNFASNLRDIKDKIATQNNNFYKDSIAEVTNLIAAQKEQFTKEISELIERVDTIEADYKEKAIKVTNALENIQEETKNKTLEDLLGVQREFKKSIDEEFEYIKEYLIFLEDEIKFSNDLQEKVDTVLLHKTPKEQIKEVVEEVSEIVGITQPEQFFEENEKPKKALFRFVSTYEEPVEDENGMEIVDVDLTFTTSGKYKTFYKYAVQDGCIQRIKYQMM